MLVDIHPYQTERWCVYNTVLTTKNFQQQKTAKSLFSLLSGRTVLTSQRWRQEIIHHSFYVIFQVTASDVSQNSNLHMMHTPETVQSSLAS